MDTEFQVLAPSKTVSVKYVPVVNSANYGQQYLIHVVAPLWAIAHSVITESRTIRTKIRRNTSFANV